jgi:uncharacterized iron-regulated protein
VVSGADGSSSKLAAVAAAMRQADVVLLGEYHDDAVAHALQLALLKHVANRLGYAVPPQTPSPPQPSQQRQQQQQQSSLGPQHERPKQQQQQQQQPSRPLILSLEMFETDVQPVLSEYLAGHIPLSDLLKDARPWSNYMHDYHHLVQLCKQLQLPVVAANAPRRYVSLAGRVGSKALLQLPAAAKQWLPPLPHAPSSEAYVRKVQQNMQQAAAGMDAFRKQQEAEQQQQQQQGQAAVSAVKQQQEAMQESSAVQADSKGCPYIGLIVSSNFLAAQSLWDATMAHALAQVLQQHQQPAHSQATGNSNAGISSSDGRASSSSSDQLPTGPLVVHVCGKFHCEDRLGIPEHLATYTPEAKVLVVVFTPAEKMTVTAEEAAAAGLVGCADFVVLTDSRLPRSFTVEHPV